MWKIKNLKTSAKAVLKENYWLAFLVSVILWLISGGGGIYANIGANYSNGFMPDTETEFAPFFLAFFIIIVVLGVLIGLAFNILLKYPLEVGTARYFIEEQRYAFDLNNLGFAFNGSRYLDIVKAMLWRAFLTFLWFLLLIIPGIIAIYAYRMTPYILADNPNIGYKRAVKLSVQMTRGHKFRIFLLDLSFLGWLLLGFLLLFVGVLFVWPYINATYAELYVTLRQLALDKGLCTDEELLIAS